MLSLEPLVLVNVLVMRSVAESQNEEEGEKNLQSHPAAREKSRLGRQTPEVRRVAEANIKVFNVFKMIETLDRRKPCMISILQTLIKLKDVTYLLYCCL